jgi:hypothetical protein
MAINPLIIVGGIAAVALVAGMGRPEAEAAEGIDLGQPDVVTATIKPPLPAPGEAQRGLVPGGRRPNLTSQSIEISIN